VSIVKHEMRSEGGEAFRVPCPLRVALEAALGMTHKRKAVVEKDGVRIVRTGEPEIVLESNEEIEVFIAAYLAGVKDERGGSR